MKRLLIIVLFMLCLSGCAIGRSASNAPSGIVSDDPTKPAAAFELEYKCDYGFYGDSQSASVMLCITPLEHMPSVYEFRLGPLEGVPEERLFLGYFYMDGKEIYRYSGSDAVDTVQDVDEFMLSSYAVSSDKDIHDNLPPEDKGLHHSVEVLDGKSRCNIYNTAVETGFYETFIWDFEAGLYGMTEYSSGFGAERDYLHIYAD